jgi:putative membrane protein
MPLAESDPRVFFAAERTLLAWLRTGLTIIALGFVVARFGLFLRLVAFQLPNMAVEGRLGASALLGILFVGVGAVAILVATIQHRRFVRTLSLVDLPPSYNRRCAV